MQLLLVRHAIAAMADDRPSEGGRGDEDARRALTDEGRRKMVASGAGLAGLLPGLDLIATSPYRRAVETAEILAEAFAGTQVVQVPALAPAGEPSAFLRWLGGRKPEEVVAAVGHEPSLSFLAAWLLTGHGERFFAFKKGGACLLDLPAEPAAGGAELLWLATAGQLRRIAE